MAYFPAFIKLDNLKVLIVGGGGVASDKLLHMLDFTRDICVIAPWVSAQMQEMIEKNGLSYEDRVYRKGDINGFGIVIVAVDDMGVQRSIYDEAKIKGVLCNCVDSVEYCDFIFPSYIKNGDLTIAVSTSGASPAVAKYLRKFLEKVIPNSIAEFLEEMKILRTTIPKGKNRMKFLDEKAKNYFDDK